MAFLIWQPDWPGLWNIDHSNQIVSLNEAYYAYKSFTKLIRPGFQIVAISDPSSLAAFSQRAQTLVLVTVNYSGTSQNYTYNLPKFTSLGSTASIYRTSATEQFASLGTVALAGHSFSYTANAGSVTTYVISASYQPAVITVNDNTTGSGNNQFNYSGSWGYWNGQTGAYDNDNHWSGNPNDYYTFQFTGQQARIYGALVNSNGIAAISVDNGAETYVDTYAANRVDDAFLYATPTLGYGTHTLKVRVTGLKHPASTGTVVNADRIDVISTVNEVGQGIYYVTNASTGQVLDAYGSNMNSPGTVGMYALNGGLNQRWNLMAFGDGSYRMVNVNSGENLDVVEASTANGAAIDQYEDKGAFSSANQRWYISPNGDGTYTIANVNSGLNLEVNGSTGGLDQRQNTNTSSQHWTLTLTN